MRVVCLCSFIHLPVYEPMDDRCTGSSPLGYLFVIIHVIGWWQSNAKRINAIARTTNECVIKSIKPHLTLSISFTAVHFPSHKIFFFSFAFFRQSYRFWRRCFSLKESAIFSLNLEAKAGDKIVCLLILSITFWCVLFNFLVVIIECEMKAA